MVSNTKDMKVHMKPLNCTSYGWSKLGQIEEKNRWSGLVIKKKWQQFCVSGLHMNRSVAHGTIEVKSKRKIGGMSFY